jgi:hypothetical protein
MADGLPRTRRRSIHASRNLSRAPSASLLNRLRRPWTKPVCRQVRQQSGSGRSLGRATARSVPPCRPGISTDAQDAVVDVGHAPRRRVSCVKAMPCQSLGEPGHGAAHPEMAAVERRQKGRGKLQIISLSCKPICKPDAAHPSTGYGDHSLGSASLTAFSRTDRAMASMPDIRQDTDLRILIEPHWPDARH